MSLYVNIKKVMDNNFTLDVEFSAHNEITALLGASGCGKSMTLKCIAGIEEPDEGTIVLDGRVLFDSAKNINLSPQKRKVGYLFQNYALVDNETVEYNLKIALENVKADNKEEIISKALAEVGLQGYEKKQVFKCSGGEQQRIAIARLLIKPCELVLADEPTGSLDHGNKLIVIDAQFFLPHAKAAREYINSLNKPIECLIISHSHPDHWFGSELFADTKIYALKEVKINIGNANITIPVSETTLIATIIRELVLKC